MRSETPKTDTEQTEVELWVGYAPTYLVSADFARDLEKRLNTIYAEAHFISDEFLETYPCIKAIVTRIRKESDLNFRPYDS